MKSKIYISGLVCLIFAFVVLSANICFASISGTVNDTSGNPVSGVLVTFTDESNPDNQFSDYTDDDGKYELAISPVLIEENIPSYFHLHQNYPNPFNPTTTISYYIGKAGFVNLSIYNITGQKIRTLVDNYHSVGSHTVTWNGLDDSGKSTAAGIYIYRLKCGDTVESRKMLLIDGGIKRPAVYRSVTKSMANIGNTTYRVTIYGSTIVVFQQGGITLEKNKPLDFIVKLLPHGLQLVSIPSGTFEMGDEVGDLWDSCRPVHTVTLSSFEMSTTEITNAQYATYLNEALVSGDIELRSGYVYGKKLYLDIGYNYNTNNKCWIYYSNGTFTVTSGKENWPVIAVTWYGSKAFALYYGLDLPREAEWEYAARGGKQYKYGTDDGTISVSKANYDENIGCPVDVGSYPANPFGLYDMSGNVWEWCNDWYYISYYASSPAADPTGPSSGTFRVGRSGSWRDFYGICRSAYRAPEDPREWHYYEGFRVVRRSSLQN